MKLLPNPRGAGTDLGGRTGGEPEQRPEPTEPDGPQKHYLPQRTLPAAETSDLHPCPTCGHKSMDECWAAGKELLARHRRICLDCHDECLPKVRRRAAQSRPAPRKTLDPRLFF